jgi:hypothetical protein
VWGGDRVMGAIALCRSDLADVGAIARSYRNELTRQSMSGDQDLNRDLRSQRYAIDKDLGREELL